MKKRVFLYPVCELLLWVTTDNFAFVTKDNRVVIE